MAEPMEIVDVDLEKAALGGEPAERAARVDEGSETDADVDRMALLGGEPAERASGVDEGDGTERKDLWLPKAELYCEDKHQRNKNANRNLPSTHGLPLKGEWTVYPSGETTDSRTEIELEGCKGGASEGVSIDVAAIECCQQLGTVDGDPGREDERRDALNELTQLLTQTAEPYVKSGGDIPHVYLRGTRMRLGNANGPGSQTDGPRGQSDMSKGQADRPRGWTDTLSMSDSAETAVISHGERVSTYLGVRDAKCPVQEMDGAGDVNMYLPLDAPIEVPSRMFAFGQVEGADEVIAPSFECEGTGDGDGDRDGDDGGVGGTMSGSGIHSIQVNAVLLAGDSQHMHQS